MAMLLKSLFLAQATFVASEIAPGDCAFVGIYGEQDDFAVVLLEDADGEELSISEDLPSAMTNFEPHKAFKAKRHVMKAQRGSVLKRSDFSISSDDLVAPLSLTLLKGESPTALCSITLRSEGTAIRKVEGLHVMSLKARDTAEYSGSTDGKKEDLLEAISEASNWLQHVTLSRKLFTIASGNATETMTTTMLQFSTTVTSTVSSTATSADDDIAASNAAGSSIACGLLLFTLYMQ